MPSKAKLRQYQQLRSKKFRQKYGLFVVEGLKSINELLHSNWPVETILCTSAFCDAQASEVDGEVEVVDKADFMAVSQHKNPQEVLAIAKIRAPVVNEGDCQIALDGINDPGNLGTIMRIADWYGINTVYCSTDTVDTFNSKVIQATMGSFLRVNVVRGDLSELLKDKKVFATLLDGDNVREISAPEGGVLLIGNEANGISEELLNHLSHTAVTIPGSGTTESLNAAMATAICCERLVGG